MVERNRPDDRDSGKTRGKWHYEPQKAEDIRARATRSSGRFDSIFKPGFDTWRAKGGDNLIRYLPGTWNLGVPYAYDIWVHRYVGPDDSTYLCINRMLGKTCPICEAAAEAKRAKDDEENRALRAIEQRVSWILDRRGEMPKQPLLFQMSKTLDNTILSLTNIKEQIWIDNPTEGFDVTIKRSGTGLGTRYIAAIDRDPSPIADKQRDFDKIMEYIDDNPIPDVLHYFDADYLERVISGTTGPREEEKEETTRGRERSRDDRDEPRRDRDRDGERDERAVRSRRDEPEPDREERSPRRGRDEPRDEPEERERPGRKAARDEAKDEEDEDRGGRDRREPDDAPRGRGGRSDPEEEDQARDERRARGNGARKDDKDEAPFDPDPPVRSRRERADEDTESRPRRSVERQRPDDDEPRTARRGDDDEEDRRPPRRR